jgi:hypothetical protein
MPLKDPEARREYQRRYREANRAKISERQKSWYLDNRDDRLAAQQRWLNEHREEHAAYNRKRQRLLRQQRNAEIIAQLSGVMLSSGDDI